MYGIHDRSVLLTTLCFLYIVLYLEVGCSLQIVRVQPVCAVLQEHAPNIIARVDGPTGRVPEPRTNPSRMCIPNKLGDIRELLLRYVADAAPADGDLVVGGGEWRQGRVPGRVQRRVG